jgi:hypothetical protein
MNSPESIQMRAQIQQLAAAVGSLRAELEGSRGAIVAQSIWLRALVHAAPDAHNAGRAAGTLRGPAVNSLGSSANAIKGFREVDEAIQRAVSQGKS